MNLVEMIGRKFGRLTVMRRARHRSPKPYWHCQCECGKSKVINGTSMRRGLTRSCGCLQREIARDSRARGAKHGLYRHPLYNVFMKIKDRCENQRAQAFHRYGGRGIRCLFSNAEEFIAWGMASGYRTGLTVDRKDNDGHYSADNCRLATYSMQARNRNDNRILTVGGESRCVKDWSEITRINYATIYSRLRRGVTPEKALGL